MFNAAGNNERNNSSLGGISASDCEQEFGSDLELGEWEITYRFMF